MSTVTNSPRNEEAFPDLHGAGAGGPGAGETADPLPLVSAALSALGFLTLLRLADRRDRSPAKALGLFLATTLESTLGTALGVTAVTRSRQADGLSRGLVLGGAGTILGVLTTIMNFNWMRTRRRL
jgi:hypothetical protein